MLNAVHLLVVTTAVGAARPGANKKLLAFAWPGYQSHGFAALEILNKMTERGYNGTLLAWSEERDFLFKHDKVRDGVEIVGGDIAWNTFRENIKPEFLGGLNLPKEGEKWKIQDYANIQKALAQYPDPAAGFDAIFSLAYDGCVGMLKDKDVVEKIRSADMIVADFSFLCAFPAAWLFDKEIVTYSCVGAINGGFSTEVLGPAFAAYTPMFAHPAKDLTDIMSPAQQVHNRIFQPLLRTVALRGWFSYMHKSIIHKEVLANLNADELARIDREAKVDVFPAVVRHLDRKGGVYMLLTDPVLEFPRSIYSSSFFVGHPQSKDAEPLKDDGSGLKQFADGATKGLVLVSLGTFGELPQERADILATGLNSLNMKVVWKVSGEQLRSGNSMPDPSTYNADNFLFMDWVPQNDILGHANTKLMVMHGGMNGFNELSYHGVPGVGIPIIGDQFDNIARGVRRGYLVREIRDEMTVESITRKLNMCLTPAFREAAAKVSRGLRAHPLHSSDRMANVVEMAINMGGAGELRPQATRMTAKQIRAPDLIVLAALCLSGDAAGSESCQSHATNALALQGTQGYEDVDMGEVLETAKGLIKAYGFTGDMVPEIMIFN